MRRYTKSMSYILAIILIVPGNTDSKLFACSAGDPGSIPGLGRSSGNGNGIPILHSSILAWRIPWTEKPRDYSPWGHREMDTTEQLRTYA